MYCILCPLHPLVWYFCTKHNAPTTIYQYSTLYCILRPLHPLVWLRPQSTASTGSTFLHQTQCPHHHIPLLNCVLHTVSTASTGLTFLYQRQCPHYSTAYCIHCILRPLCPLHGGWPFCTKGNGPQHPYLLSTLCQLTFLHQHLLHPLHPHCVPTASPLHPLIHYMLYIVNLSALTKCPHNPATLLITHETITNQKLAISNQYLMSPPPSKKVPKSVNFFTAWPI